MHVYKIICINAMFALLIVSKNNNTTINSANLITQL